MSEPAYAFDGAEIRQSAERAVRALSAGSLLTRVVVLPTTPSTQDDARRLAAGSPGLVVIAEAQTRGRGRLGRYWADISMKSLAATFALGGGLAPELLSLAAGVGACRAIESFLPPGVRVGVRWPNDVVEFCGDHTHSTGRKLSGVLIEAADALHLVGIGINVSHDERDWPADLASRACSLRQLGCDATRAEVAAALISHLAEALSMPELTLVDHWRSRNVLLGQQCGFVHDGTTHTGIVHDIDPANEIVLETSPGAFTRLPALTTSMLK